MANSTEKARMSAISYINGLIDYFKLSADQVEMILLGLLADIRLQKLQENARQPDLQPEQKQEEEDNEHRND